VGWEDLVSGALSEDIGHGDLTAGLFSDDHTAGWFIESEAEGVLCGIEIARSILGGTIADELHDGVLVGPRKTILSDRNSPTSTLLTRERTALNFLMHLSGVATLTREYVQRVAGTGAQIVDTRKTTPGLRSLQKYAVRCGGGTNHRRGLDDGAMVKDNHIAACGGIRSAVATVRALIPHTVRVEVECENLEMVEEAIQSGADIVMLDNMSVREMHEAVAYISGRALVEASGGVTLASVYAIAETGVDLISVGALTHSAPAMPYHLVVP